MLHERHATTRLWCSGDTNSDDLPQ